MCHRVAVTMALAEHLAKPGRGGRDGYFPVIPELIEDPHEIWLGFVRKPSGLVVLKRRYLKLLDLGNGRSVMVAVNERQGYHEVLTVFSGRVASQRRISPFRVKVRRIPHNAPPGPPSSINDEHGRAED